MVRRRLQQILKTLPVARRIAVIVATFAAIVGCLLLLTHIQLDVLSGVRAFVGGESLWSKAQKDAVQFLKRYADTGDPGDYRRYLEALAVPLGDQQARLELDRRDPDMRMVREGFLAGRNHPRDLDTMARFYRNFRRVSYMATAVAIWKLGDRHIAKLRRLGEEVQQEVTAGKPHPERLRLVLAKIDALNDHMTPLEDYFSRTLAEGAAWLKDFLLRVTWVVTAALLTIGLLFTWMMLRHLREWEGKYRHLLETASDAILVAHGETGAIIEANRRAGELLGLPVDRLLGMQQAAFHLEREQETLAQMLADVRRGRPATGELHVRRADGQVVPVEVSAAATELGGKPVVQSILREISERRRAEAALRASRRRLEEQARVSAALARVGRELISSLETPVVLDRLCQLTAEVLGCRTSETLLWDAAEDAYAPVACHGEELEGTATAKHRTLPREMLSALFATPESGDVAELRVTEPGGGQPEGQLVMLLRRGREIVGVQLASGRRERFTESERRIAEGIAYVASMALANARLVGEIERASRTKSEFVSTMSHELRTPLHVILGYTEMARDAAAGGPPLGDCLGHIESAGRDLLALIEGTLEIGRIDAGRDEVRLEPIDIAALWALLGEGCARLPRRPEVQLDWVDGLSPAILVTDARKLTVVVRNLVGNALKFTEHGWVRAEARLEESSLTLRITDTGIGIRDEDQESIFEMFRQADGSDTRRFGGTGLGLYIVRRFVQQLGGTIGLDSAPGRGSTFTVLIPLDRDAPGASRAA